MTTLYCGSPLCRKTHKCQAIRRHSKQPIWCGLRQDRERIKRWEKDHQRPQQQELTLEQPPSGGSLQ
jgi:hypothetical protein